MEALKRIGSASARSRTSNLRTFFSIRNKFFLKSQEKSGGRTGTAVCQGRRISLILLVGLAALQTPPPFLPDVTFLPFQATFWPCAYDEGEYKRRPPVLFESSFIPRGPSRSLLSLLCLFIQSFPYQQSNLLSLTNFTSKFVFVFLLLCLHTRCLSKHLDNNRKSFTSTLVE